MWKIGNLLKYFKNNNEYEEEDVNDDIFEREYYIEPKEELEKEDKKYDFPILRSKALEIADDDENLKSDYCRNAKNGFISWLSFKDKKIKIVEINNKKYWQIQILDADISGVIEKRNSSMHWDGTISKEDSKLLRCLIDTQTGEYIYYPDQKRYLAKIAKSDIFRKEIK